MSTENSRASAARCLLCGAKSLRSFCGTPSEVPDASSRTRIALCPDCGVKFLDPMPGPQELARWYPDTYSDYHFDKPVPLLRRPAGAAGRAKLRLKRMVLREYYGYFPEDPAPSAALRPLLALLRHSLAYLPHRVPAGSILDIGSSTGHFMALLRELGWRTTGVELQKEAARFAREELGLDVRAGTLEEARLAPEAFDAVSISHVLEHVPEPRRLLREARRLLRPGGELLLKLPDTEGWEPRALSRHWHWGVQVGHIWFFGASSVTRLLREEGWEVEEVLLEPWTTGRDVALSLGHGLKIKEGGWARWVERLYAPLSALGTLAGNGSRLVVYARKS